jgi:adenylate kinase family enzyme
MDGDLGPYDVVDIRIREADTVIFLDFPLLICAWRAIRRSRERTDFWRWLLKYRSSFRPTLVQAFTGYAPTAKLYLLTSPKAVTRFIEGITRE